jgi:hypothetical protein
VLSFYLRCLEKRRRTTRKNSSVTVQIEIFKSGCLVILGNFEELSRTQAARL